MNFSFRPHEKLKNKADIQFIFDNGIRHLHYPILFFTATFPDTSTPVRSPERGPALRLGFSVPKKKFKRAVDRNRIKRQMRECTRLQKHRLYNHLPKCDSSHLGIMMVYIGHKIPAYSVIFDAVSQFTLQYAKSLSE